MQNMSLLLFTKFTKKFVFFPFIFVFLISYFVEVKMRITFNQFFDKLYEKNKEMIDSMLATSKFLLGRLEGNPRRLMQNFYECNIKAQNIYIKTYHQLQRYNKYKANIFSIRTSILIYSWGILSFLFGILWPIFGKKCNYYILNIVPISFYIAVILIAVFMTKGF